MKRIWKRKLFALACCTVMILAICVPAYAETGTAVNNGWLNYSSGGCVFIPECFSLYSSHGASLSDGFTCDYNYPAQSMTISITERDVSDYPSYSDIIVDNYYYLLDVLPEAVYNVKYQNEFTLSAYAGKNIYYIQQTLDHGTLYTLEFNYPTANRRVCDSIVEQVCASFSTSGYNKPGTAPAFGGSAAPTLNEVKAMVSSGKVKTKSNTGVSLVLPGENQMLDTPFRTSITNGKDHGSIYLMPKPEAGHGYTGTVKIDTEVWIVAETRDFYFFVTDDGKMGWNGKSYFR